MNEQREQRKRLLAKAEGLLAEAIAILGELSDSYPEGGQSACHPKLGYRSTGQQLERLRKALKMGKV